MRKQRPMCCCVGAVIDIGVEWRPGDSDLGLGELLLRADRVLEDTASRGRDATSIALYVESLIIECWPDRAYFVEAWTGNESDGFIQIFQPYGIPRNL